MQLKESEREHRREVILDSAIKLFSEYPFSEIGMRDIAKEAGISPASIYRYFSSRDDILMEVLGQDIQEGKERQKERLKKGTANIEDIAVGIVDFFLDKDSTLHLLSHFMLNESIDPEALEKFKETKEYYLNHLEKVMIDSGVSKENIRLFSQAFFASILGIIIFFRNSEQSNKEETRKHLYKLARLIAIIFKKDVFRD